MNPVVAIDLAADRLDLERRIQRLEELFPTKSVASLAPATPTTKLTTTTPLSASTALVAPSAAAAASAAASTSPSSPMPIALTMEEEARIHNKLDRCIEVLREMRMGMSSLSSLPSSTTPPPSTAAISTTASSTTAPPPPTPAAPTSTATAREPLQALPTRCSTLSRTHGECTLAPETVVPVPSSTSSRTLAAPTSLHPATAAAPHSTPAQVVMDAEKDVFTIPAHKVFDALPHPRPAVLPSTPARAGWGTEENIGTTTPTKCSTYSFSHDMIQFGLTIKEDSVLDDMQQRYIINPTSAVSVSVPPWLATRLWSMQQLEGMNLLNSVLLEPWSAIFADKEPEPYILMFERVCILPKPPWSIVCFAAVQFWLQFNFGWVTWHQKPQSPPPVQWEMQTDGVHLRPMAWPPFGYPRILMQLETLLPFQFSFSKSTYMLSYFEMSGQYTVECIVDNSFWMGYTASYVFDRGRNRSEFTMSIILHETVGSAHISFSLVEANSITLQFGMQVNDVLVKWEAPLSMMLIHSARNYSDDQPGIAKLAVDKISDKWYVLRSSPCRYHSFPSRWSCFHDGDELDQTTAPSNVMSHIMVFWLKQMQKANQTASTWLDEWLSTPCCSLTLQLGYVLLKSVYMEYVTAIVGNTIQVQLKRSGCVTLKTHTFTNGSYIKLLLGAEETIHKRWCSSLLSLLCNDAGNHRELHGIMLILKWLLTDGEYSSNGRIGLAKLPWELIAVSDQMSCNAAVFQKWWPLLPVYRSGNGFAGVFLSDGAQIKCISDWVACTTDKTKPDIYISGCAFSKQLNISLRSLGVHCLQKALVGQQADQNMHCIFMDLTFILQHISSVLAITLGLFTMPMLLDYVFAGELSRQHTLDSSSYSLMDNILTGGQAPLKFMIPPEEPRHGTDMRYKLSLHHKYFTKLEATDLVGKSSSNRWILRSKSNRSAARSMATMGFMVVGGGGRGRRQDHSRRSARSPRLGFWIVDTLKENFFLESPSDPSAPAGLQRFQGWNLALDTRCGEPQIDRGFAGEIARRGARQRRLEQESGGEERARRRREVEEEDCCLNVMIHSPLFSVRTQLT